MRKQTKYLGYILLLALFGFEPLLGQENKEKTKEFESKRYDFRLDKVVVFINVFDEDLKTAVNGSLTVKNSKGEVVQSFTNEAFSQIRLPIQEVYEVEISKPDFSTEKFTLDLRKVQEYEFSKNIYLRPDKTEVRVSAKDLGEKPDQLVLKMQSQTSNEQIKLDYNASTNEFVGKVRPNTDYNLEIRNPSNNFTYTQPYRTGENPSRGGANSNQINLSADRVKSLSQGTFVTQEELRRREQALLAAETERNNRISPAKTEIDSLLARLDIRRRRLQNDSIAFESYRSEETKRLAEQLAEKKDNRPEPKTYEELLARTQEDLLAAERLAVERQEKIRDRLVRLNKYLEGDELNDEQKASLREVIKTLEKQLEQYDLEYQRLRSENFAQIDRLQSKLGIMSFQSFLRQYWYLFYILFAVIGALFIAMIVFYFIARTRRKQRDQLSQMNEEINQQNEEIKAQRDAIEEKNNLIEIERRKSEELLLNILPAKVADELKTYGKAKMRNYQTVSVIFTDFKGFTQIASKLSADKLMDELNDCFTAFDEIIAKHNLEKIKTIGDAYMCAGGIPEQNETNPLDSVLAGLEMQRFMVRRRKEKLAEGDDYWQCRLGINTGEIRAGVIGTSKFAYDIWGDPVNIASRMESGGEVNKVNISAQTYELIKDFFDFEYRGEVEVKNGLFLPMYFVNRIKPELSADAAGLEPNEAFIELKYKLFGVAQDAQE